jgi:hypothetical protein
MNPDYEQHSAEVDRVLKELPELSAPDTLISRVLKAVHARARLPWYQRSWETWPRLCQAASFAVLLAMFLGLCVAGANLPHFSGFLPARHALTNWIANAGAIWHAAAAILNAFVASARHLGSRIVVAALVAVGTAYALCVGLGTVCVRLVYARR